MHKLVCLLILICSICFLYSQTPIEIDIYSDAIIQILSSPGINHLAQANASYQARDYETTARQYLQHLATKPDDASALYNLACCYGLLGRERHASQILLLAYKAGFEDLEHIRNDTDFDAVRQSPDFVAGMDSLSVWQARKAASAGLTSHYQINTYLPYRLYYPDNYQPDTHCTLLVGLHGYGDNATAFGGISRLIKDMSVIYLVPEAPYLLPNSPEPGFSWTPSFDPEDQLQRSSFIGLKEGIVALVRQIQQTHAIDRTILFGFSQGSFMTYSIGLTNPDVFDALLPCGGWLEPEMVQNSTVNPDQPQKVFISHGLQDNVIGHNAAEEALSYLQEHGYAAQLSSFEGAHRIDRTSFMTGLDWLIAE